MNEISERKRMQGAPTRREAALNMATWCNIHTGMGFSSSLLRKLWEEGLLKRIPSVGCHGKVFYTAA